MPSFHCIPRRAILDAEGIPADKKIIGVAIRRWEKKYSWTNDLISYINKIASLKDYAVVFIPMQSPDDRVASEEIAGNLAKENIFRLQGGYTLDELISIIGNCNLIVGMRLHALIFSALMRVPFIGISYDPKIDNFLSLIGLEPGASVQHLDAEKLYNKTCHILEHGMPPKVWDSVQDLQHYAGENANILRRFVETKEETR